MLQTPEEAQAATVKKDFEEVVVVKTENGTKCGNFGCLALDGKGGLYALKTDTKEGHSRYSNLYYFKDYKNYKTTKQCKMYRVDQSLGHGNGMTYRDGYLYVAAGKHIAKMTTKGVVKTFYDIDNTVETLDVQSASSITCYKSDTYIVGLKNDSQEITYSIGKFEGIGEKTAKKIVDTFKENTIEEIKAKNPLLLKIKGMNEKKLNELSNKMNEFEKEQEIILEFNKLGFTTDESLKIINKYKSRCFDIIENNIYALENDINFLKLDKIYTSFHNEFDNIRVSALIKYSIKNMCYETGNTLVDKESLYLYMSKFFNDTLPSTLFLSTLEDLITTMEVVKVKEYITLNYIYETETSVASSIDYLTKITDVNSKEKTESMINTYEKVNDIKFNTDQKNAVINSLTNNFFIISGGPGTGKTTIIKAVVDIYEQLNPSITSSDITLLAPTGRASKRLSESVLRKTI